ncbi:insulin-like peptide isoform X6 [Branchiostoma floridae x Branchiostoma belcheri]
MGTNLGQLHPLFPQGNLQADAVSFFVRATGMNLSSVYVLASLAVVCLLVRETRAEYLCGSTLADVLSFVCGNRGYNSQPRRSLGKRAIDFISEQQAKDYMGSMPPVRRRRGLVEECCLNVCDYSHLESYCNPHPTAPATASPVRTTESQPEEQERDEELAPLDGMFPDSSAHQYPTDLVEEGPTNEIPETPSQKPTLERLGYKDNQTDKKEPAENNNNNNRARDNRTKSSTVEPHTVPDYISKQYTHKPLITLPKGTPRRIDAPGQLSLN